MLSVFLGDDVVRAKAEAILRAQGREVVRLGDGEVPLEALPTYLEQQGMFAPAVAIIADRQLETAEQKEFVLTHAEACKKSDTLVICIQPELDAATKKKLEAYATIELFETVKPIETPPPNAFALVDALQVGDRKRAWILYRQLIESGSSAEEVHGTLAWAARSVVLASRTQSATEAGMKPYPYDKAKRVARSLKPGEAESQSAELVRLYHDARLGKGSLEDLLEAYVLRK